MAHPHSKGARRLLTGTVLLLLLPLAATLLVPRPCSAVTSIYATGFEASEGYTTNLDLVGQNGCVGSGSGGNGIVAEFFPGLGQQAYVGFTPPSTNDSNLVVWQPINLNPVPTNTPIVSFSALMGITDSSNTNWDDFYWSVYNSQGDRLFTLDFDNYYLEVNYALDGTNQFVSTGATFTNGPIYTLTLTMDFGRGRWSAALSGVVLATNQPMTTTNAPLNLGDVDAVWVPYDLANPGDNFMVFDNYQLTRQAVPRPPRLCNPLSGWTTVPRCCASTGSRTTASPLTPRPTSPTGPPSRRTSPRTATSTTRTPTRSGRASVSTADAGCPDPGRSDHAHPSDREQTRLCLAYNLAGLVSGAGSEAGRCSQARRPRNKEG